MGPVLLQSLDDILGSGRLKLLNAGQRDRVLNDVASARQTRRGELLKALERSRLGDEWVAGAHPGDASDVSADASQRTGADSAAGGRSGIAGNGGAHVRAKVTRQLAILTHSEQIAKYVMRSADVLYPPE